MLNHLNVGEEINHVAKTPLVQLRTGKVLGQNIFETLVLLFNAAHGIINYRAYFRSVGGSSNRAPSCILRDEENVLCRVFILVFFEAFALIDQFSILCLETVGYIFQKNQA